MESFNRKRVKLSAKEAHEGTSWPSEDLKKRTLYICSADLLWIDMGKLMSNACVNFPLEHPDSSKSMFLRAPGFFIHKDRLFAVGGVRTLGHPADVYEVNWSSSLAGSPKVWSLSVSTAFPRLNSPKPKPLAVTIGCKVYVLNKEYGLKGNYDFEVLDLDSANPSWTVLSQPPFRTCYRESRLRGNHIIRVGRHYVTGSRLYVNSYCYCGNFDRLCYFDTKTNTWEFVSPIIKDLFLQIPGKISCSGGSFAVLGLKLRVILSMDVPKVYNQPHSCKLFATLVTSSGHPVCYQDIFKSVFLDHFSSPDFVVSASLFDVGHGLYCAMTFFAKNHQEYLFVSLLTLSAKNSAAAFDNTEDKVGDEHYWDSHQVISGDFLDVAVIGKCIFKRGSEVVIPAAFLL